MKYTPIALRVPCPPRDPRAQESSFWRMWKAYKIAPSWSKVFLRKYLLKKATRQKGHTKQPLKNTTSSSSAKTSFKTPKHFYKKQKCSGYFERDEDCKNERRWRNISYWTNKGVHHIYITEYEHKPINHEGLSTFTRRVQNAINNSIEEQSQPLVLLKKVQTLRSNDATVTRTSLKRWICVLSVFIVIIPIHLLCQL